MAKSSLINEQVHYYSIKQHFKRMFKVTRIISQTFQRLQNLRQIHNQLSSALPTLCKATLPNKTEIPVSSEAVRDAQQCCQHPTWCSPLNSFIKLPALFRQIAVQKLALNEKATQT